MLSSRSPVAQPSGTVRDVRDRRAFEVLLTLFLDRGGAIMRPSSAAAAAVGLLTLSEEEAAPPPTARR